MKKAILVLVAAAFYATTASALPVVTYVYQTSLYKPSTVQAAGFHVELHGTPPGSDVASAIAGLHGPSWAGSAPLKLLAAEAKPGGDTRLVLIFNGAGAPSETACARPEALGCDSGAAGSSLRVLAIYCSGDRMIARGVLSDASVTGPGQPYRDAMQSLLTAMFPPQGINISPFGGGI